MRTSARQLDLPGQVVAVLALGCLAAGTIEGGQRGWTDSLVVGGFVAFIALAVLFLAIEFKSKAPMLPLSLFRARAFSVTSLAGLLVNIAAYGLIFVFSLYFQRLNGYLAVLDRHGIRADDGRNFCDQSARGADYPED